MAHHHNEGSNQMSAMKYLLANLIASGTDSVAINTIFKYVPVADMLPDYRELYVALREVWDRHGIIEPQALFELLAVQHPNEGHRNRIMCQFQELFGAVVGNATWRHYLITSMSQIRAARLITLAKRTQAADPTRPDVTIDMIKGELAAIENIRIDPARDIGVLCDEYFGQMNEIATNGQPSRIMTGFGWEEYVTGFRPGDYILLAARPKMGKSAVANAVVARALEQGKRVMLVNNEMDETSVLNRLVANIGGVKCSTLQSPERMSDEQMERVTQATDVLRQMKLNLYCLTMRTPRDIDTEARRLRDAGTPVDIIVIDYLQLLQASDPGRRKYIYDNVTTVSWELKMLANDMKVPLLVLSQLNRQLEQRTNKRPIPADLRDSGSLEQDATAVMFLYRDEAYNPDTADVGICEINVSLNRNGKTGVTKFVIDFDHMNILNYKEQL
jgi:replicative DNA helicase